MSFTTDDVAALIIELGASLTPAQYNAFSAAAYAALGNCSGPGAAYRILRDLQRSYFDPPSDARAVSGPRHHANKLTMRPPIAAVEQPQGVGRRRTLWARR